MRQSAQESQITAGGYLRGGGEFPIKIDSSIWTGATSISFSWIEVFPQLDDM